MICVYLYPSGRTLMHICYIGCVGDSMRQSRYSYTAVNRQWLIPRLNTNTQRTKKVYKIWNQDEPKQTEAVSSFCDVEITERYVLICTRRFSEINIRIEHHIVKDFSDNKCVSQMRLNCMHTCSYIRRVDLIQQDEHGSPGSGLETKTTLNNALPNK